MYYATFDEQGNRITSYHTRVHKDIPSDAIPISDADQALYVTGEYIRDAENGKPIKRPFDLNTAKAGKLGELRQAAAAAYVAGFYSNANGEQRYYDSDEESQKLISGVYSRTKEADWATKVRYPGLTPPCPAGKAPMRARPTASDPDTAKVVYYLDAAQLKTLNDDLDDFLYAVKLTHWGLQAQVAAASTEAALAAIKWPTVE